MTHWSETGPHGLEPINPDLEIYSDFPESLLNPELPVPSGVIGPGGKKAIKRFDVYRNNVTVSLIRALGDIFPATLRCVGTRFFESMATIYLRQSPPRNRLLFRYGEDFPSFIESFEPAARLPWLADVARIERAWLDSYHAADAVPLEPDALAAVEADKVSLVHFEPHPACRILRSESPAVTIFSMNREADNAERIERYDAEDALITRPHLSVDVRKLPPGGAIFLATLCEGRSLVDAATLALGEDESFDLSENIAGMLEAGAFTALRLPGSERPNEI